MLNAYTFSFGKFAAVVVVSLTLLGCSILQPSYRGYSVDSPTQEDIKKSNIIVNIKKVLKQENEANADMVQCLEGKKDCKPQEINPVVIGLMSVSDSMCNEHVRSIFGNDAAYNLGFGSATNLFAGAATVANSTGAKTLFSSIALFSNAERSLVNEVVYKTMLTTAITTKIKESRSLARTKILSNLDQGSDKANKYGLIDFAIMDVLDYHYKCSFMNGLELALKEGTQKTSVETRIIDLERTLVLLEAQLHNSKVRLGIKTAEDAKKSPDPDLQGLLRRIEKVHTELEKLEIAPSQ